MFSSVGQDSELKPFSCWSVLECRCNSVTFLLCFTHPFSQWLFFLEIFPIQYWCSYSISEEIQDGIKKWIKEEKLPVDIFSGACGHVMSSETPENKADYWNAAAFRHRITPLPNAQHENIICCSGSCFIFGVQHRSLVRSTGFHQMLTEVPRPNSSH